MVVSSSSAQYSTGCCKRRSSLPPCSQVVDTLVVVTLGFSLTQPLEFSGPLSESSVRTDSTSGETLMHVINGRGGKFCVCAHVSGLESHQELPHRMRKWKQCWLSQNQLGTCSEQCITANHPVMAAKFICFWIYTQPDSHLLPSLENVRKETKKNVNEIRSLTASVLNSTFLTRKRALCVLSSLLLLLLDSTLFLLLHGTLLLLLLQPQHQL